MFTSNKPKNLGAMGANTSNSRHQFVAALNASFDTAESLLHKNNITGKNLKQTKLTYGNLTKRPKIEDTFNVLTVAPQQNTKPELFLLPLPQPKAIYPSIPVQEKLNRTIDVVIREGGRGENVENSNEKSSNPSVNPLLLKNGRNKLALMGRVDFCLKMHKVHSTMDALWDIYGQLKKITKGKQRGENVLLLRNSDGGPVLQSIYYDSALNGFESGCFLRVVGRFIGENRLHTFKLQRLEEDRYLQWIEHFIRIQNVSSFALLQNEE